LTQSLKLKLKQGRRISSRETWRDRCSWTNSHSSRKTWCVWMKRLTCNSRLLTRFSKKRTSRKPKIKQPPYSTHLLGWS